MPVANRPVRGPRQSRLISRRREQPFFLPLPRFPQYRTSSRWPTWPSSSMSSPRHPLPGRSTEPSAPQLVIANSKEPNKRHFMANSLACLTLSSTFTLGQPNATGKLRRGLAQPGSVPGPPPRRARGVTGLAGRFNRLLDGSTYTTSSFPTPALRRQLAELLRERDYPLHWNDCRTTGKRCRLEQ